MSTTTGTRASARLGLTLRRVLLAPREGFEAAAKLAARRHKEGIHPAEGRTPGILALLEGAALMAVWLKVAGLAGLRAVPAGGFRWANLAAALLLGALVGGLGLALWSRVGPYLLALLRGDSSRRDCRVVWGASGIPAAVIVLVLLPLDLLLVGPQVFTTDNLVNPLATAWAAFSIASSLGLVGWAGLLFVRGTEVTASLPAWRAAVAAAGALLCVLVPAGLVLVGLDQIAGRLT